MNRPCHSNPALPARGRTRLAARAFACVLLALVPLPVLAHSPLSEQIERLGERIAAHPDDVDLYLRRAELRRVQGDRRAALADYRRARTLAPQLAAPDLGIGRLWLDAGKPRLALTALDRFVAAAPQDADGHAVRARALESLGRGREAVEDLSQAIALARTSGLPSPDLYLERARLLSAGSEARVDEALRGLDDGLALLGFPVALQLEAIDLEVRLGRYDAALRRLEPIAARSSRQDPWLAREAAILEAAGRPVEARAAARRALAAIETLPPARRQTRATAAIEQTMRQTLERLGASGPAEGDR